MTPSDLRELARLIAIAYADENDEDIRRYIFDKTAAPSLRASEEIVVVVYRRHKETVQSVYETSYSVVAERQ